MKTFLYHLILYVGSMKKRGLNLPKERTFTGPALAWKRILAFLADLLIVNLVLFFPFKKIIQESMPELGSYSEVYNFLMSNQNYVAILTMVSFVMAIFALLYFVIMEYKIGQTPGKMFFNVSVISDTKKLSVWQSLLRSLFIIPVFPFFLLWIVDPLFMFFTKSNQRLSEILSKTRTVERYIIG